MPKIIEAPLKPFWKNTDDSAKLYHGDSVDVLQKLPPRSFNMCVTSPPYWGLRDYGNDKSIEIGNEKTPKDFILKMVWVFTYVRRLLREDGTLWLNLGDTWGPRGLYGVPWRVALALQNDGWLLRQDIIWSKPAPQPESVKNRCTKAHEYVFLFSKSENYYYDHASIREDPITEPGDGVVSGTGRERYSNDQKGSCPSGSVNTHPDGRNKRSVWTVHTKGYEGTHFATFPPKLIEPMIKAGCPEGGVVLDPFIGSGTTCVVALGLGRRAVGIDLSETYLRKNAIPRIEGALLARPALSHLVPRETNVVEVGVKAKTIKL